MRHGQGSRAEVSRSRPLREITKLAKALGENRAPVETLNSHDAENPRKNLNGAREIPRRLNHLCPVSTRRCKTRKMSQKSRDGNHMTMEALMVHGHAIATSRADLVRQMETVGRAIYASQTDWDRRSST
jgi:hypothetical protein